MYYAQSAETAAIGVILKDNFYLQELMSALSPDDFSSHNSEIISEIIRLDSIGIKADKVALMDSDIENMSEEILNKYISLGNVSSFESYIELIETAKIKRIMHYSCSEIQEQIETDGLGKIELADLAQSKFTAIANSVIRKTNTISNMKDNVKSVIATIMENANRDTGITGLATGFHDFDKLTSGLQKTDLIIIAGRPAMGKTTVSYNMVENMAAQGARGMFFSLEMPVSQIMMRSFASLGSIDQTKLKTGKLSAFDLGKLTEAAERIKKLDIVIDEQAGLSYQEIILRARKAHAEKPLDFILIDYLQLIKAPEFRPDNETAIISAISGAMKGLAKDLNIPVILLSQLNRELEKRADKRPINSDLRGSGAIEQDADIICFIYRDEVYNPDSPDKGTAEFILGKHRRGPLGTVRLAFKGQYSRFDNLTYEDELKEDKVIPPNAKVLSEEQVSQML